MNDVREYLRDAGSWVEDLSSDELDHFVLMCSHACLPRTRKEKETLTKGDTISTFRGYCWGLRYLKTKQCPCGDPIFADTEDCRTPLCYECTESIKQA